MLRDEFDMKLREYAEVPRSYDDQDYELIEYIYTNSPLISNINGKAQVAMLWHEFGKGIFRAMKPAADRMLSIDDEISRTSRALAELKKRRLEVIEDEKM